MINIDKWQEIFIVIKRNKLRTFLTGLGVMFGIFILVTLLAVGKGFKNKIVSSLGNLATNSTVMWTENTTKAYNGLPRNRTYKFTNKDIDIIKKSVKGIKHIVPEITAWRGKGDFNTIRYDKKGNFRIKGSSPDMNKVNPVQLLEGRFINDMDLNDARKVIVIGTRVEELMYEYTEKPIGSYLKINGIPFKVVGTMKPLSYNFGMREDVILMPASTMQNLYNMGEGFHVLLATAKVGASIADIEDQMFGILARQHKIHPDDREAVGSFNIAKMFKQIFGLISSIGFLFWVIGFGVLITGVIGVSNIMHVVVKERTKEIGVKRALGARPIVIVNQIIHESVFITTFAGFWGLVLGTFAVEGIAKMVEGDSESFLLNPMVDFEIAILSLVVLIFFGAIAGIVPAYKSIIIKPVDALRYES
ncbi:MAG: ABC transporter permease [Marinifilaceae bacterium]|jgi:putative ABC transport system permease protein|nr:ABC transporter permease [Marinifilaceae bacterium]